MNALVHAEWTCGAMLPFAKLLWTFVLVVVRKTNGAHIGTAIPKPLAQFFTLSKCIK